MKVLTIQSIELAHTDAVTFDHIYEHIGRLKYALMRCNLPTPLYIINIDESGLSFKDMVDPKSCYRVRLRQYKTTHTVARTVTKLDHVTVMSMVSGIGSLYKPIIMFPKKQLHY